MKDGDSMIVSGLNDVQSDAVKYLGVEDVNEMVDTAFTNVLRAKLNYTRNGSRVKTAEESTHSLVKKGKTLYFKGGLKETATLAYRMAKQYLPKEVTEMVFVSGQLAELDALIARISAKESESEAGEVEDAE